MLWPSTPAAPLFRATFRHAASRVVGRIALSTRLNHLPPLTPLTSADTMRSVQIEASAHHHSRRRVSVPCVAASALTGLSCRASDIAPPTPCLPSLEAVLLPAPPAATGGIGTMNLFPAVGSWQNRRIRADAMA